MDQADSNKKLELLDMIHRLQMRQNFNFTKKEYIKASFGGKFFLNYPLTHVFLLPHQQSDSIIQHINEINMIKFNFQNHNSFLKQYYHQKCYDEIFKYKDETIKLLHILNNDKAWAFNKSICEVDGCIKSIEEKWEKGFDNFDQEIKYISDNFDQFMNKKEEKIIKNMPIDIYQTILHHLPEKKKEEWMINIIPEEIDDRIKSKQIEILEELSTKNLSIDEFESLFKKICNQNEEMKWITKIKQCFQYQRQIIEQNKEQEMKEHEKNIIILKSIEEKQKAIKTKKEQLEALKKIKKQSSLEPQIISPDQKIIEEQGTIQLSQLGSGLSKEQQLIKGIMYGYQYAVLKLLKDGANINSKDNETEKRFKE